MATNDLASLIRDSKDPDPKVREQAVGDIGDLGQRDPQAIDALTAALLDDEADDVRAFAAGSLGLLRDPFSVEPLRNALQDKYWRVRLTAIWALKELGDTKAIPELIRLCKDPNAQVRAMAALKLGEFHAEDAVEPLIALLRDPEIDVQYAAVKALWGFTDDRCLQPLRQLVKSYAGKDPHTSEGSNILSEADSAIRMIEEKPGDSA